MKRWQIGGAVALGFGLAAGAAASRPHARPQENVAWLDSVEDGQAAARRLHKPVFLVFR